VACLSGVCQAAPIIDQEEWNVNGSFRGNSITTFCQQEVTTGMSGQLTGVDMSLGIWGIVNNGRFNFGINLGEAWQFDGDDWHVIYQTVFLRDTPVLHIDTTAANLILDEGDTFTITISGSSYNNGIYPEMSTGGTGLWVWHTHEPHLPTEIDGSSMAYRTYMDPDVVGVPEPTASMLLMIAMLLQSHWMRHRL